MTPVTKTAEERADEFLEKFGASIDEHAAQPIEDYILALIRERDEKLSRAERSEKEHIADCLRLSEELAEARAENERLKTPDTSSPGPHMLVHKQMWAQMRDENDSLKAECERLRERVADLEAQAVGHERYRKLAQSDLAEKSWKKDNERLRKDLDAARDAVDATEAERAHLETQLKEARSQVAVLVEALHSLVGDNLLSQLISISRYGETPKGSTIAKLIRAEETLSSLPEATRAWLARHEGMELALNRALYELDMLTDGLVVDTHRREKALEAMGLARAALDGRDGLEGK